MKNDELDQVHLLNGTSHIYANYNAIQLKRNFILFCVLYSITHGTVDAVLAFSSSELGVEIGSLSGFTLYILYTFSSLCIAKPFLQYNNSKKGVFYGLISLLIYVFTFFIAVLVPSISFIIYLGAGIGGIGAGILWTSEGAYYAINAQMYNTSLLTQSQLPIAEINTQFAAIFAAIYLSFETVLKLIATFIFLAQQNSSNWQITVFGFYFAAATLAVFSYHQFILTFNDMKSTVYSNVDSIVSSPTAVNHDLLVGKASGQLFRTIVQSEIFNEFTSVFRAVTSVNQLQLLIPYQLCFGITSGFVNTYVNSMIVSKYLGDGYVGLLSGINTLVAVLLAAPFVTVSNKYSHGKCLIMILGAVCFSFAGIPLLFCSDEFIGQWGFIVPYFLIHGAARGVWEDTNKVVVVDYFPIAKDRNIAYACIYFSSGLAGAVGYLLFQFMNRSQLSILVVCISFIALISYLISYRNYLRS